jgi:hypothetical protein
MGYAAFTRTTRLVAGVLAAAAVVGTVVFAVSRPDSTTSQASSSGTLTGGGNSIEIPVGGNTETPGGSSSGGGSGYGGGGWTESEDERGGWYMYDVAGSYTDFSTGSARTVDGADLGTFYRTLIWPGQRVRLGTGVTSDRGIAGCTRTIVSTCPNFFPAARNGWGDPTHPNPDYRTTDNINRGMNHAGVCARAWTIGRVKDEYASLAAVDVAGTSDAVDAVTPTDLFDIVAVRRMSKTAQWNNGCASANFNIDDLACAPDGEPFYASLGYIYNSEFTGTVMDDQNWIWWADKLKTYSTTGGFSFDYQFVEMQPEGCEGSVKTPPVVVTVPVGETINVPLLDNMTCTAYALPCRFTPPGTQTAGSITAAVTNRVAAFDNNRNRHVQVNSVRTTRTGPRGSDEATLSITGLRETSTRLRVEDVITVTGSNGVTASADLIIRVTAAITPRADDKTITLAVGSTGLIDLFNPASSRFDDFCPAGEQCVIRVGQFATDFNRIAGANACITRTDTNPPACATRAGNRSVFPTGLVNLLGLTATPSVRTIPFTVIVEGDPSRSATADLTVRVIARATPTPPTLSAAVTVTGSDLAYVGGELQPYELTARVAAARYTNCPSGATCRTGLPAAGPASEVGTYGYSITRAPSITGQLTLATAANSTGVRYREGDDPTSADYNAPTGTVTITPAAQRSTEMLFYRATRPGVDYRMTFSVSSATVQMTAWSFQSGCSSNGTCRVVRVDQPPVTIRPATPVSYQPADRLVTVIGSTLR